MEKIKRFVECLVPISQCNLKCSYCYVIQENRRNTKANLFHCSPEEIGHAFRKERWGGTMLVNLCGFGETLIPPEMPQIIYHILKQGHFVNVTNNGTMSKRFEEIVQFPREMLKRLCFAFSFHYIELKRTNNLQVFIDNVKKVKEAGCSILIQLNLSDEYIECLDEIKKVCMDNFGALPQLALTRREGNQMSIFTVYTDEEYMNYGKSFNSPLFDFTCKNFKVKRKEFCYAGDWSFKLDLATGDLKSCYFAQPFYNIYKNMDEKIKSLTVGANCKNPYCINSSHFMSLGIIPNIPSPTYVELRNRENAGWYTEEMQQFLNTKLYESNDEYGIFKKNMVNIRFKMYRFTSKINGAKNRFMRIVGRKK